MRGNIFVCCSRLTKSALSRHTQGHAGTLTQRVLTHGEDSENALAAALVGIAMVTSKTNAFFVLYESM